MLKQLLIMLCVPSAFLILVFLTSKK